jgi:hypothetical protein
MKSPLETRCILNSDQEELAKYLVNFDTVIFVLPLYIHAMPGIMMHFIEHLEPAAMEGKTLGFIIQAGFIETKQEDYIERYFSSLAEQLKCNYLGTVRKGEAAGIYMYPDMFKKVLKKINDLGRAFEQTHSFDPEITQELGKPYTLSKLQVILIQFCCDIGLNNIGWHRVLKKNNAMDKRLDRPYLSNWETAKK